MTSKMLHYFPLRHGIRAYHIASIVAVTGDETVSCGCRSG